MKVRGAGGNDSESESDVEDKEGGKVGGGKQRVEEIESEEKGDGGGARGKIVKTSGGMLIEDCSQ